MRWLFCVSVTCALKEELHQLIWNGKQQCFTPLQRNELLQLMLTHSVVVSALLQHADFDCNYKYVYGMLSSLKTLLSLARQKSPTGLKVNLVF